MSQLATLGFSILWKVQFNAINKNKLYLQNYMQALFNIHINIRSTNAFLLKSSFMTFSVIIKTSRNIFHFGT